MAAIGMLKGKKAQLHLSITAQLHLSITAQGIKRKQICKMTVQGPDSLAATLLSVIHVLWWEEGAPRRDVRGDERMLNYELHLYK